MSDKINEQSEFQSMAMPEGKTATAVQVPTNSKSEKLILDKTGQRPAKTRSALYKELTKDEKVKEEEDYFEFASPSVRGVGFLIDLVFAMAIVKLAIVSAPFEVKLLHELIFDKYSLDFMFGESVLLKLLIVLSILAVLFFLVVIPVAFFNVSIGKKLTGQRVRNEGRYTISISQAFKRELIYKPIGIICFASFIMPFYDKKKKTLHDKWAKTFVIKE